MSTPIPPETSDRFRSAEPVTHPVTCAVREHKGDYLAEVERLEKSHAHLLAACKRFESSHRGIIQDHDSAARREYEAALSELRATIAKAQGGAQ